MPAVPSTVPRASPDKLSRHHTMIPVLTANYRNRYTNGDPHGLTVAENMR